MLCQSCSSRRIVAIKGHNYCLNCGNEVIAVAAASEAPRPQPIASTVTVAPVRQSAPVKVRPPAPKVGPLNPKDARKVAKQAAKMLPKHRIAWSGIVADLMLASIVVFPALLLSITPIDPSISAKERWLIAVALCWLLVSLAIILSRIYLAIAQTFGISKRIDHRPQPAGRAHQAGRQHLGRVFGLRVLQFIAIEILAAAEIGLVIYAQNLQSAARLPAVFIGTGLLLVAGLVIGVLPSLARPAVVTEDAKVGEALRFSGHALIKRRQGLTAALGITVLVGLATGAVLAAVLTSLSWSLQGGYWSVGSLKALPFLAVALAVTTAAIHYGSLFSQSYWLLLHHKLSRPLQSS